MRDDDDSAEDESSRGRLIYAEFSHPPERADYAIPVGDPAVQGGGPEFERPELAERTAPSSRGWTRTGFLWAGVVGLSSALVWGLSSRAGGSDGAAEAALPALVERYLDRARSSVDLPIEEFVVRYSAYIWLVKNHGGQDPRLWRGMERLAKWSLLDRQAKGVQIARELVAGFKINQPPAEMSQLAIKLDELIWEWERNNR